MVPIYATGDPMASDDYKLIESISTMGAATILNVTATAPKMRFAFISSMFVVPAFACLMLYRFRDKYYSLKQRIDPLKPLSD